MLVYIPKIDLKKATWIHKKGYLCAAWILPVKLISRFNKLVFRQVSTADAGVEGNISVHDGLQEAAVYSDALAVPDRRDGEVLRRQHVHGKTRAPTSGVQRRSA